MDAEMYGTACNVQEFEQS